MKGRFVVFEGIDGSGKSTQAHLLTEALRKRGLRVEKIREPGATVTGEKIRALLLDPESAINTRCELFLYMAARAQLVGDKIAPLIKSGGWVICDRYLYSSAAYQGEAGGLGVDCVLDIGKVAIDGAIPDKVFFLDLDPAAAAGRMLGKRADRIERRGIDYQRKVRRGFLKIARRLGRRAVVLDGSRSADELHQDVLRKVL